MSLIDVLGTVLNGVASNGRTSSSSANNPMGGIDIMSVIQAFSKANGGANMGVSNGGIDIASILRQMGGANTSASSGSGDLIGTIVNAVLKNGLGSAMGNKGDMGMGNMGAQAGSAGPLGNMSISDIASMATGAASILKVIMANKK